PDAEHHQLRPRHPGQQEPQPHDCATDQRPRTKNSPSRAALGPRAADRRNHRLTRNSQTEKTKKAASEIGVETSKVNAPNTRSGPATVKTAMADRPAACVTRTVRRCGRRLVSASATGIMRAVPSEPTRSLA